MNRARGFAIAMLLPPALCAVPALAQTTAQVCGETERVLEQLEREKDDIQFMQWTRGEHEAFEGDGAFALPNLDYLEMLRDANAADTAIPNDDYRYLVYELGLTGVRNRVDARRVGLNVDSSLHSDRMAVQREMYARMDRISRDASRFTPAELTGRLETLRYQLSLREARLEDLNCESLPKQATSADNGLLQRTSTRLQQDHGAPDQRYTYGDDFAELLIVGDPPDRRRVRWEFAGVPGSLNPGDVITITIKGTLDFQPAGAERGANNSAGVRTEGLVPLTEENAFFYQGASRDGTYMYSVPLNATRVVIALGADNNQGIFIRHCYGACEQ